MAYREYSRPSIDLDSLPKKWELRPASEIMVGAILPDRGMVVKVETEGDNVILIFPSGFARTVEKDLVINSFQ